MKENERSRCKTFTQQNFQQEVLDSDLPVMVEFWGVPCSACEAVDPVIEELASEFEGMARVGKLKVNDYPELAKDYRIIAVPTFVYFKKGQMEGKLIGGYSKRFMAAKLRSYT